MGGDGFEPPNIRLGRLVLWELRVQHCAMVLWRGGGGNSVRTSRRGLEKQGGPQVMLVGLVTLLLVVVAVAAVVSVAGGVWF